MKRYIIFGYLTFFLFSIIMIEKTFWFMFISLVLYFPIKKIFSKMSYNDVEEIFFIKYFRNKYPNNPLFR
jgi:hypothetical protein